MSELGDIWAMACRAQRKLIQPTDASIDEAAALLDEIERSLRQLITAEH